MQKTIDRTVVYIPALDCVSVPKKQEMLIQTSEQQLEVLLLIVILCSKIEKNISCTSTEL